MRKSAGAGRLPLGALTKCFNNPTCQDWGVFIVNKKRPVFTVVHVWSRVGSEKKKKKEKYQEYADAESGGG